MYRYDPIDQQLVDERVAQFRDQTRRFLAGELGEEEYRGLRLRNGLYVQRHAPMLRVAIPYGLLSAAQLRKLAHIARTYDRGYGHFTTRQNIQFNWPRLEDVPEILAELATVQMHAIQTSGNCVRNVTTDPFAGVAADEIVDSLVWCEIVRQWSTFNPEFNWLPRKFKIAINGAAADRSATWVHDIGLHAVRVHDIPVEAGEPYPSATAGFRVIVGGGLGRAPAIGQVVREFLPWRHLLTYLDAILRVYNRYGRRDNLHKARLKFLLKERGLEPFRDAVEAEWSHLADGPGTLVPEEIVRVQERFTRPTYLRLPARDAACDARRAADRAFARWVERNVHPHKVPGYAAVTLSLKKTGVPPGDVTADQMEAVADLAERHSFGELRVTHEQNLVFADVARRDLPALWQALRLLGLATPNAGLITNIIACPGGDFCSLASARSVPVAESLQRRFDDLDYAFDIGELDLNISGCINACGHHHVGHIGILGVDKAGEEFYQIEIGGNQGETRPGARAALGKVLGRAFAAHEVGDAVERLVLCYLGLREADDERFIDVVSRVGTEPFKEALYGNPDQESPRGERQLAPA